MKCNSKSDKAKDSKYICNEKTGKWVLKTGKIGQLISATKTKPVVKQVISPSKQQVKPVVKQVISPSKQQVKPTTKYVAKPFKPLLNR